MTSVDGLTAARGIESSREKKSDSSSVHMLLDEMSEKSSCSVGAADLIPSPFYSTKHVIFLPQIIWHAISIASSLSLYRYALSNTYIT
jgi:hypothetical protein